MLGSGFWGHFLVDQVPIMLVFTAITTDVAAFTFSIHFNPEKKHHTMPRV